MRIIYFDGVCGLCNGFVDFVMKIDKQGLFQFSPLQSDYAKTHLPAEYTQNLDSVVFQTEGKIFRKSKAVFMILEDLGGPWKTVSGLKVLPEGFTNWGYDLVAKYRYRIFGKKETCRLPTPEERARFIM